MLTRGSKRSLKGGYGLHGIGGEGRGISGSTDGPRSTHGTKSTRSSHLESKGSTSGERREDWEYSVSYRIGRDRFEDLPARQMNLESVANMLYWLS